MPEVRHDPLLARWVVIAENRDGRPNEFIAPQPVRQCRSCPFCPGNESQTPAALLVRRPADWRGEESQWRIRVVANLYPAVDGMAADVADADPDGLFRGAAGHGIHEVIIDTADHVSSITESSEESAVELFDVYRERVLSMAATPGISSALVFKNVGAAAGASIEHAHSQIVATPRPTAEVGWEWSSSRAYFEREGACAFCRMIAEERNRGLRIVDENDLAVAFCPFASRFPYETWVLPKRHAGRFEGGDAACLGAVARTTRKAVARLERVLDRPAYNYVVHSAPFGNGEPSHYHWHVELYPRVATLAGFELGGGCFINPVSPERAAERLRDAIP